MSSHILEQTRLEAALRTLGRTSDIFAPVQGTGERAPRLQQLGGDVGGEVVLEPRKPLLPLKTLFLPRVEALFRFHRQAREMLVEPVPPLERDRIVLGALACDVEALALLDRVFLEDPVDEAYAERRQRTTIGALACTGEDDHCFCRSIGVDPLRPPGVDLHLLPVAVGLLLEPRTDKGEQVIRQLGDLLRPPTVEEEGAAAALTCSSREDLQLEPPPGGWAEVWEANLWEEGASRCLGCGVCTSLCPTCYCFDVEDLEEGEHGVRYRAWDSCMYCDFTRLAGGENPRPRHRARFRQRFLHKLEYFPQRHGVVACTGCGRCAQACPVSFGIGEAAASLRPRKEEP